jgi:uncharacterized transporter YbjL
MSIHTLSTFDAEAMRIALIVGAITMAFISIALLRAKNPAQGLDTLLIATTFVAGGLWWKHFHFVFHTLWVDPRSSESHALLNGLLLSAITIGALVAISSFTALDALGKQGIVLSILIVGIVVAMWWWKYHYVLQILWGR